MTEAEERSVSIVEGRTVPLGHQSECVSFPWPKTMHIRGRVRFVDGVVVRIRVGCVFYGKIGQIVQTNPCRWRWLHTPVLHSCLPCEPNDKRPLEIHRCFGGDGFLQFLVDCRKRCWLQWQMRWRRRWRISKWKWIGGDGADKGRSAEKE